MRTLVRCADKRSFPVVVAAVAFAATLSMSAPFATLLVAAVLMAPRRWVAISLWSSLGAALDAFIHWYNAARIKISLGARSPREHRESLGIAGNRCLTSPISWPHLHWVKVRSARTLWRCCCSEESTFALVATSAADPQCSASCDRGWQKTR